MSTRTVLGLIGLPLLTATGCSTLWGLMGEPALSSTTPTACIVRYSPLTPLTEVGYDDCGNFWVRRDGQCYILADSTSMIEIECPAEGDTLGDGH